MNCAFGVALLGIALFPLNATSPAQTKIAKSSQTNSAQAKSSKTSPGKPGTARRRAAGRSSRRAPPRPSYQLHPDPERYQLIQQALADRGYFKGQVNGEWGGDSVDALKRFQADQKILDDGKISALTLTDLGLGPKHNVSSATSAQPPASNSAAIAPPDSADTLTAPATTSPSQNAPAPTSATPPR